MPSRTPHLPKYRHYKPKDLAVVRIRGKDHYLGKFGSEASRQKYRRLIAELLAAPSPAAPTLGRNDPGTGPTVNELLVAYWDRHVTSYYVKDGRPTSEQGNIRQALRFLRRLYGPSPAKDFGPRALTLVRAAMIDAGRCRKLINKDVHRIRQMFRWAVAQQLYPGTALHDLLAVAALEKGRSAARERPPVAPVPEAVVRATLPHLSPQVAAMVRLQLLTAARPGEITAIRPRDVDRSDPACWVYRPGSHKTEHHGRARVVLLGPRAQQVLRPWLDRDPGAYCFSPAEVVAGREAARKPGPTRGASRPAARPKPGGCYTKDSYRVAIARACDRAFPHPTLARLRRKDLTAEQRAELWSWRRAHRWHPHRLRHTRATEIRRRFDAEAAQTVLGHSKVDTTVIYAERDLARAREVMIAVG
jgi:integrase